MAMHLLGSESVSWADKGTAIGTIVLGVAALATIAVSLIVTRRERKTSEVRSAVDRAQALEDLQSEREHARSIQASEREHSEGLQIRARQATHAATLVETLDDFQDVLRDLPLMKAVLVVSPGRVNDSVQRQIGVQRAVRSLRRATRTAAVLLASPEIILRMERLTLLADAGQELRDGDTLRLPDKAFNDILGYTIFVQLGLEDLISGREPQPLATWPYPVPGGIGGGYWYPNPEHQVGGMPSKTTLCTRSTSGSTIDAASENPKYGGASCLRQATGVPTRLDSESRTTTLSEHRAIESSPACALSVDSARLYLCPFNDGWIQRASTTTLSRMLTNGYVGSAAQCPTRCVRAGRPRTRHGSSV
ncbi:hypothetical protein D1871_23060 [Nakamurella silvestris]|nr:hypothetical protein D1871_23060 [Nakamurella silvestris]